MNKLSAVVFILGALWLPGGRAHAQSFAAARLLPAAIPVASSPLPVSVVADGAGNTYVAGGFRGTVQFGSTTLVSALNSYNLPSIDLYVAKLDPQGNALWAVRTGSPEDDESTDLVRSASGVLYLLGTLRQTATVGAAVLPGGGPFVARLNEQQGSIGWAVQVGNITCTKLATNAAGTVLLSGYSSDAVIRVGGATFSNPGVTPQPPYYQPRASTDGVVALLSATGTWQWVRQLAAPTPSGGAVARSGALDAQGNAYLTGYAGAGTVLDNLTIPTDQDFVAKLSPAGTWLWQAAATLPATANYSAAPTGVRVAVSAAGNVYWLGSLYSPGGGAQFGPSILTASLGGYGDVFLAKLTSQGQFLWAAQSTGYGNDFSGDVALDAAENAYVTGGYGIGSISGNNFPITFGPTVLPNAGQEDIFITKLDANGAYQWALGAGGSSFDRAVSIGLDNQGVAYITGTTTSPVSAFGSATLNPSATAGYGFWARVVGGPLAAGQAAAASKPSLELTPNPCREAVSIAGPGPGQPVQVLDALGRQVLGASMPATGPLRLALPGTLPSGVYVVRSGLLTRRLALE